MLVTRLLGRASQMALLDGEKQRSLAGEFRCVLLSGDPGVGKTRLANEFLARQDKTTPTLLARAYPFSSTASFGVWGEAPTATCGVSVKRRSRKSAEGSWTTWPACCGAWPRPGLGTRPGTPAAPSARGTGGSAGKPRTRSSAGPVPG